MAKLTVVVAAAIAAIIAASTDSATATSAFLGTRAAGGLRSHEDSTTRVSVKVGSSCTVNGVSYPLGFSYTVPARFNCAQVPSRTMTLWCTSDKRFAYCCGNQACQNMAVPPAYPLGGQIPSDNPARVPVPSNTNMVQTCGQWGTFSHGVERFCKARGQTCPEINTFCGGKYGDCAKVCCSELNSVVKETIDLGTTCKKWAIANFGSYPMACNRIGEPLDYSNLCSGFGQPQCSLETCCQLLKPM